MRKAPTRSSQDDLTDVFATFPDAMAQFDHLRSLPISDIATSDVLRVWHSYADLVKQLECWRSNSESTTKFSYQASRILNPEYDGHLLDLVPKVRQYPRMIDSKTNMTYFVSHLVIYLEMLQLHQFTDAWQKQKNFQPAAAAEITAFMERQTSPAQAMSEAHGYCDAIVESVEQFLHPESGVLAAGAVVFPIMMSIGFLAPQGDPRVEYLLTVSKRYQATSRYPLDNIVANAMAR